LPSQNCVSSVGEPLSPLHVSRSALSTFFSFRIFLPRPWPFGVRSWTYYSDLLAIHDLSHWMCGWTTWIDWWTDGVYPSVSRTKPEKKRNTPMYSTTGDTTVELTHGWAQANGFLRTLSSSNFCFKALKEAHRYQFLSWNKNAQPRYYSLYFADALHCLS